MSSSKKKKDATVFETDMYKLDGRHKNKNRFCKKVKCKLIKECVKGKLAAIAYCEDNV